MSKCTAPKAPGKTAATQIVFMTESQNGVGKSTIQALRVRAVEPQNGVIKSQSLSAVHDSTVTVFLAAEFRG
jgi:ABC-type siderophore export system fused ATPase/permease subunit